VSAETLAFLALGAVAGGFINGLSGTGTALFALGFYLLAVAPETAVAIVAFMAVLAGLQGVWVVRAEVFANPRKLLWFLLPGLAGVPLGVMLLDAVDARTLRLGIAALLIVYGGYFGFRAVLPSFSRVTPGLDAGVGFTGGVLGGLAGLSGALPVLWLSLRPWTKAQTRAVLQPYNVVILSTTVVLLALRGAYDSRALTALLITVPLGMVAAQVGIAVFKRLSDTSFRRLLILLTLLMGLGILASELL